MPGHEAKLESIAFVNANVVPMAHDRILHNQTVVVKGGSVVNIGNTRQVRIPTATFVIDCLGKRYLMPGLADMHVHAWRESELLLFVANGVTTIRNMWGSQLHLSWKKRIAAGSLIGPTIYTAGPLMDGDPPIWKGSKVIKSQREAEEEVAREKRRGYDFAKVYSRLSPTAYNSIVASAKRLGLPVAGHVPDAVGLERALEVRQDSIEHLDGYLDALETHGSRARSGHGLGPRHWGTVSSIDRRRIPHLVKATVNARVWNCVTLSVFQKWVSNEEATKLFRRAEMGFVPPELREEWDPSKHFPWKTRSNADLKRYRKADGWRKEVVGALNRAGAKILLGTDTPNPFVVPGFSIHEELQSLVDAGLSPFEAIRAGTKDAAAFLGASDEFGTIQRGKRADLILTRDNPLDDVRNVSHRIGVMLRGKWFSEAKLRKMLESMVKSYPSAEAQ